MFNLNHLTVLGLSCVFMRPWLTSLLFSPVHETSKLLATQLFTLPLILLMFL